MLNSADQSRRDMRLAAPLVVLAILAVTAFGAVDLAKAPAALPLAAVLGFAFATPGSVLPGGMRLAFLAAAGLFGLQLWYGAPDLTGAAGLGLAWAAGLCSGVLAARAAQGAAPWPVLWRSGLVALLPAAAVVVLLPEPLSGISPLRLLALAGLLLLVQQPLRHFGVRRLPGSALGGAVLALAVVVLSQLGRAELAALAWVLGRLLVGPMLRPAVAAGFTPVWAVAGPVLMLPVLMSPNEIWVVGFLPLAVGLALWEHGRAGGPAGAGLPDGLTLTGQMETWHQLYLAELNLESRLLRLTRAGQTRFGTEGTTRLNDWLSLTPVQQVPEFMSFLRSAAPGSRTLQAVDLKAGDTGATQPFGVTLIRRNGPVVVISLQPQTELAELQERVRTLEAAGASAILREERLLSLAAHELRTPVSILSMVGEELKEGGNWQDTGAMYDAALSRLITVLDDLRAGSGDPLGRQRSSAFSPAAMVQQLLDQAGPVAAGRGQKMTADLPESAGEILSGDAARIELVLSRMISATLRRPETRNLRLTLSRLGSDTLVWVVSDDAPALSDSTALALFSPFATTGTTGSGADYEGLGLYTARKAALSLGGALDWQPAAGGNRLIFTHPAQTAPATHRTSRDVG